MEARILIVSSITNNAKEIDPFLHLRSNPTKTYLHRGRQNGGIQSPSGDAI